MLVVIDTNILVSALWSKNGAPARILSLIISGGLIPCYDYRILNEYKEVLIRPKFKFTSGEVSALLGWIADNGRSVMLIFRMRRTRNFMRSQNFAGRS